MELKTAKFDQCRLLVVGDLMIDEYVWGKVDRISPEAPVQVVTVHAEDCTLGGSGNVINNLAALGATVFALGVTGADPDRELLLKKLHDVGTETRGIIAETDRLTTRKTRIIAERQQVLRIDRESRKEITPETFASLISLAAEIIPQVDLVLISDYGKGLITRSMVQGLVQLAVTNHKIIIADPKGLDFTKYTGVTLLTPNSREALLASGVAALGSSGSKTILEVGERLLGNTGIGRLLITCGKDGMILFEAGRQPFQVSTRAREVYDVSGAGDTVVAVLGLGMAAGLSLKEAISLANTAAGIVVGKIGTATVSRQELLQVHYQTPEDTASKFKSLNEISEICRRLRNDCKRIVLTNGCFDLLHVGHIRLFTASKQQGDVLIVAIDDDESVRLLKGGGRPVINAAERVRVLSALNSVDYVLVFASGELDGIIKAIRPDVLTKGSDYDAEDVLGRQIVESYGGRIELIPITEEISSTQIIDTIKNT